MSTSPVIPGLLTRQPQIIDGMRGPQTEAETGTTFTPPTLPIIALGHRVFRARYRRLRLHLGKRPDKYDNATGSKIPGFEFTAVFDDYLLELPSYYMQRAIPEEERAEFLKRLENHPSIGIDFWDVATLQARVVEHEEATARDILSRNPSLRSKLAAEAAQADGFALPKREKKAAPTEVAPAPVIEEPPAPAPRPRRAARPRKQKTADTF